MASVVVPPKTRIIYFKPSGKYAYEGELLLDPDFQWYNIGSHIRMLATQHRLPGLLSGGWSGYAVVGVGPDDPFPVHVKLGREDD